MRYLQATFLIFILFYSNILSQTAVTPKQEKSFTIGLRGIYTTGPWMNQAGLGAGGNLKFEWKLGKRIAWYFQGGYYYINGKQATSNGITYKTYFNDGEVSTGVKFLSEKNYFGLAGISINSLMRRTDVVQYISGWKQESTSSSTAEKFGLIIGGGYTYHLSDLIALEGMGLFNYLGDEGSNLALNIGVKFKFY
ncbi:MAG: hypothetical protein J0L60_07890 [Ignavibacteria bacterium]|nr:hypothetical protein [Ignavibacteria bacterium]